MVSALLVLGLPFLEYLGLRYFFHDILQFHVGWGHLGTDYTLLIPAVFAHLLLFSVLSRNGKPALGIRKLGLAVHFCLLASFLGWAMLLETVPNLQMRAVSWAVWWVLCLVNFFSALFVLVEPRFYFKNRHRAAIVPCILILLCTALHSLTVNPLWGLLGPYLNLAIHPVFQSLFNLQTFFSQGLVVIPYPGLPLWIGVGCAGFDGIYLILFSLLLWATVDARRFSIVQWISLCGAGTCLMFLANIVRIVIIAAVGFRLVPILGQVETMRILKATVHGHIGWLLYLGCIGTFFFVVSRIREPLLNFRKYRLATFAFMMLAFSQQQALAVGCGDGDFTPSLNCSSDSANCTDPACPACCEQGDCAPIPQCFPCSNWNSQQASCGLYAPICVWNAGNSQCERAGNELPELSNMAFIGVLSIVGALFLRRARKPFPT